MLCGRVRADFIFIKLLHEERPVVSAQTDSADSAIGALVRILMLASAT
jgi:hypothetical protein